MDYTDKSLSRKSRRDIKRISAYVDAIEALDAEMQALSDEGLKGKTQEFKERFKNGESLDSLLVEAFAAAREAASRAIGLKPYRVQLMGGIILHEGRIAEMKTGEGKTLVSVLPAYLNALTGEGVHIVTVNDYLAKRDAEWMGKVHQALGLSVGVILSSYGPAERKSAYSCDITYVTNNELGFDYLRDNMAIRKEDTVQRGLNYAIIDEVDSVLIDEARTPLIISGAGGKSTDLYKACDVLARQMVKGTSDGDLPKIDAIMGIGVPEDGDFLVNEKDKQVMLTQDGVKKVEEFFHISNLADEANLEIQHNIALALRAHSLMVKDKDYVVKDGEVLIVDTFTGRIMPGRRYSDGLHQAIEAKEHVKVNGESATLATITFQNFFNKYGKKCGMTGTALTEEKEFIDIYGMDVVEVPTNMPMVRVDHEDSVYLTKKEKLGAVIRDIEKSHEKGQPVLVGTPDISLSEEVSRLLSEKGIRHNVLNAKSHELEAGIISHAGEKGAVTIATNMAGRGTDIKLEEGVAGLGGLKVIGTERHESRRIDNQLRGRSGRQGDPGESKFYLSLEDDLLRLFGADRMMKAYKALKVPEGEELKHKTLSKQIGKAQKKIENNNFGIRKNLLDYDEVNNIQREAVYAERKKVLEGEDMKEAIYRMAERCIDDITEGAFGKKPLKGADMAALRREYSYLVPAAPPEPTEEELKRDDKTGYVKRLKSAAMDEYHKKEEEVSLAMGDANGIREAERTVLLRVIDKQWPVLIDGMDKLRESIGLQSYAQKDPVVQYKKLSYGMFREMAKSIRHDTVRFLMHVRVEKEKPREAPVRVAAGPSADGVTGRAPYRRKNAKVGRNDPCPCGSGKKYKHCCGQEAS